MMAYKNYCDRRAAQKGQASEESHCCPLRMPVIGSILFSLFIFSPYFLPSSDSENFSDLESNSAIKETLLPVNPSQFKSEVNKKDPQDLSSPHIENLGK